jgi:replication-associated recombination protein RarA
MLMTFAEVQTPGGHRAGEVASALQKCIRRGLADDALYWATELDLAGFGEYVFKRLVIIASEDVGLADPHACQIVAALRDSWRDQRKKDDKRHVPERLFLVHAVLYLARAPKSRMIDHALIVHYEGKRERRKVPDFALDRHTSRGGPRNARGSTSGRKEPTSRTTPASTILTQSARRRSGKICRWR